MLISILGNRELNVIITICELAESDLFIKG